MTPPRSPTATRIGVDLCVLRAPYPLSLQRCVRSGLEALRGRDDVETVRLGPMGGSRGHWRLRGLGRAARRSEVDGVHAFVSGFSPTAPGPRIQTVHELPWHHGESENADLRHRLWIRLGGRFARAIVCPSEHVARDLRAELGSAGERVRVIPWGVDRRFGEAAGEGGPTVELGGEPFDRATLLLPLGGRTKKRASAAVEALAHLPRSVRLVVTGPDGPGLDAARARAAALGLGQRLHHVPWIEESDLPLALAASGAVLALARSEGFAHPVLEALATGTPVVAAPGGAQEELAGGCAELADPEDSAGLAAAIGRALAWTEEQRRAARERAARFTWERWAESTALLWRELTQGSA
ncbi:glycosyltransferase [Engelhardtia mirabilis]|uniref:Lipopolysaccharide core biosynthesis protein RfaG n=1 Tax=Engelhardtia mirabilis TaxID=2528011 RepID=A0A518BNV3_9BACT|nr:Lipopolysaccharide core biosynthesis protein RfaG [Planctomycetes bacterium Pla133]QDV02974.1 Lipopolysaccharide core biosynthesis protein RfaG [Planctomycetes bacterium Pla86]